MSPLKKACESVMVHLLLLGSLVTKDVPPYALVGGNPAKALKFVSALPDWDTITANFLHVLTFCAG